MKPFGNRYYRLRDARLEVRLIYTGFLLFALVGLVTMAAFQLHHIGITPTSIATYYRGGERAGEMLFAKTFRELVEVTHFHSFVMGIVYLIMAHLLIATEGSLTVQRAAIVAGLLGLLGDLLVPWLICYVAAAFAWLQLASWSAEWFGFAVMIAVPLREMWFAREIDELPPD